MRSGPPQQALVRFGALLRAERLAKGLSLRELAARTSVSNAYLSELERGRHEPSLSILRAIASALDIPLGAMLVRAGVLDDGECRDREWDAELAIERDPALTEPQRMLVGNGHDLAGILLDLGGAVSIWAGFRTYRERYLASASG